MKILESINQWRRTWLFLTASEANAMALVQMDIAFEAATANLKDAQQSFLDAKQRAFDMWSELQQIKLDVNNRSQVMQITLTLDRKSLAVLDVEDASRILAQRTEKIYLDAIKKRLAVKSTNNQ